MVDIALRLLKKNKLLYKIFDDLKLTELTEVHVSEYVVRVNACNK